LIAVDIISVRERLVFMSNKNGGGIQLVGIAAMRTGKIVFMSAVFFCGGAGGILDVRGAETEPLQFVNPDVQLGAVAFGKDFPVTFVLTNRSDKPVKIVGVDTSCHCTSVEKSPGEISAHGSGKVELNFNSSRADGPVTQSVVIETGGGQIITGQFQATVGTAATNSVAPPQENFGKNQLTASPQLHKN
jgi:hypothetical protein